MTLSSKEHAARIEAIGLQPVQVRIAVEGGAAVHPALRGHMDSVWTPAWSIVERWPDLVPLWSSGTTAVFADVRGSFSRRSAELPDESLTVWPNFESVIRHILTDMWELDDEGLRENERRIIAELLLPTEQVEAALQPVER